MGEGYAGVPGGYSVNQTLPPLFRQQGGVAQNVSANDMSKQAIHSSQPPLGNTPNQFSTQPPGSMMFNQRQPGPRTHAHPQFYPSANGAPRHLQPGPQVQQIRMNHQQLSTLNMAAGLPGTNKGPQVTHIPVPQIPVNPWCSPAMNQPYPLTKEQVRLLLLYDFRIKKMAANSIADINTAFDPDTVSKSTAYDWYSRFQKGNESLEDQPRTGRPSEFDNSALQEALEANNRQTSRELADLLDALYPPQNVIYQNQMQALEGLSMNATKRQVPPGAVSQAPPVSSAPKEVTRHRIRLAIIDPETGRNVLDDKSESGDENEVAWSWISTTDGAASIPSSEMQHSLKDSHSRETPISEEEVPTNEGNDISYQFATQLAHTALGSRPVDYERPGAAAGRGAFTPTISKGVVEPPPPSRSLSHVVIPPASESEDTEIACACHSCRERITGVCYKCVECVDYMICSTCEADGIVHTGHNMLRLKSSASPPFHPVSGDVHQNLECASCHGPIRGSRYKCLQCPEIDLCHTCETRGTEHSDHHFIRLPSRMPVVHLTPDLDGMTAEEHPGVMCDSCHQGVRGRRFKCLVCPEFNLCSDCEQLGEQHLHHPMIRFSKPSAIVLRGSVILPDGLNHGVTCTECEGSIKGYRYKCLKCRDYDLCTRCEAASKHLQHRMLRMPPKCESQVPVPSDQLTPSPQADPAPRMTAAGRAPYLCRCGEMCRGKPRYVCLQCPSYGHCPQCEARKTHKEHIMLRVPEPAFTIKYLLGLTCDECGNAISDLRYRCLTCPDFHLCPACEERKVHSIHPMLRLFSRTNSTAAEMNQPSSA
ncbi:unnamed protein product, partial [Darwinula stevensoni]